MVVLWFVGFVALGLITFACYESGFDGTTTHCVFLVAVVMLSFADSVISSLVFCAVATLLIDYFFAQPVLSFHLRDSADVPSLISFVVASLIITALVRRMQVLSDVRRDQAKLLDLSRDAVIVRNMDGVVLYWNQGAADLFGWTSNEAVGQISQTLLGTRFPTPFEEVNSALLRTGKWEGELVHTKRDGAEVVMSSRWYLHCDDSGRPLATLENGNDIGVRKRAEDALRCSQAAFLAEAQSLSLTGSFGWDIRSGEVYWSNQTFHIFEYELDVSPTFDLILQRVHPDDRERLEQTIEQMIHSIAKVDFECRLLMSDGRVKFVRAVVRASTVEGDDQHYIGAVMDITAARKAETQLQDAQNELARVTRATTLGELSSTIAHEVNQPLNGIVIDSEAGLRWLKRPAPNICEASACLERVVENARRAAQIIKRIRALATKGVAQVVPLELDDVVNDVVSLTQREVASYRASMRVNLEPALPPLLGDRVQLQQVLINLVMNGIQAMDAISDRPRDLLIESWLDEAGNIAFAVRDSGTGIRAELEGRLFEAFFSTKPRGMGMGLSVCRSIIHAHGGQICAFNNEVHGATFQCSLPPLESHYDLNHDRTGHAAQ
ncbi:ATP-binding protein [Paraburkholderia rhizosphaerae]|nr:ATP-binding protein [Paraburkholderia rhizosphaerae]